MDHRLWRVGWLPLLEGPSAKLVQPAAEQRGGGEQLLAVVGGDHKAGVLLLRQAGHHLQTHLSEGGRGRGGDGEREVDHTAEQGR